MKKSFMTRALAMGLSLAMAFSMSAATNVTTAAAAAKPAMKSSKMTVKVGQTKGYNATTATQKAYKITKTKVSKANADKATITIKKNKKGIKVTGEKAVSKMSVRIYFKNNKTKKTTSKVSKLTVKAVVTKQSIVNAEATGVKKVTLTMAKDVASVASPVAITVKKGTTDRTFTATSEGKTITLNMDAKLTAGDYTVTIKNMEDTDLIRTFNVEKDEYLKTFEISDKIIAESLTSTTTASIKYKAVNQYGEMMNAGTPTVSCSFGTVPNQHPEKDASATNKGVIKVTKIPDVLAIPGQTGTVVIVDTTTGISASQPVTYTTFAAISEATIVGTYNINNAKVQDITAHERIDNYELLLTAKDCYGDDVDDAEFNKQGIEITVTGGVTNLKEANKSGGWKTRIVDGKEYIAVGLTNNDTTTPKVEAYAGEANIIIVNGGHGLVYSGKLKVSDAVIIKTASITDENGIYDGEWSTLSYEFIDQNGNPVTSYAVLDKITTIRTTGNTGLKMTRKTDGTAKIAYKTPAGTVTASDNEKATTIKAETVGYNDTTSGNYFVGTYQFTIREARVAKTVMGLNPDQTTGIAFTDGSQSQTVKPLEIKFSKLYLADQYSNKVVDGDDQFRGIFYDGIGNTTGGGITSGVAVYVTTNAAFSNISITDNSIILTPSGVGSNTIYLKYRSTKESTAGKNTVVNNHDYDYKFQVSAYNTANVDLDNLSVDINDGNQVRVTTGVAVTSGALNVKVYKMLGGQKTEIPAGYQTQVIKIDNDTVTEKDVQDGKKTKTATVHVLVNSWDDSQSNKSVELTKDITISIKDPEVFKIDDRTVKSHAVTTASLAASGGSVKYDKSEFAQRFKVKNQYGDPAAVLSTGFATDSSVEYYIENTASVPNGGTSVIGYRIHGVTQDGKGTNGAYIEVLKDGYYEFDITAKAPNGSTKTYTLQINAIP